MNDVHIFGMLVKVGSKLNDIVLYFGAIIRKFFFRFCIYRLIICKIEGQYHLVKFKVDLRQSHLDLKNFGQPHVEWK